MYLVALTLAALGSFFVVNARRTWSTVRRLHLYGIAVPGSVIGIDPFGAPGLFDGYVEVKVRFRTLEDHEVVVYFSVDAGSYTVGDTIWLKYDPTNIHRTRLDEDRPPSALPALIHLGFGMAIIVAGIIVGAVHFLE